LNRTDVDLQGHLITPTPNTSSDQPKNYKRLTIYDNKKNSKLDAAYGTWLCAASIYALASPPRQMKNKYSKSKEAKRKEEEEEEGRCAWGIAHDML